MSERIHTCPTSRAEEEEQQHRKHQQEQVLLMNDPESLVVDNHDDVPSSSCAGGGAKIAIRKKRNSDFALTSYNSAFLEGLFEDIAANTTTGSNCNSDQCTSSNVLVDQQGGKPDPSNDDVDEAAATTTSTLSLALPSDHNIAKRRCVSTNKSLGRCGRSLANLSSLASVRNARVVRKKSSGLMSSSPKSFADLSFLRRSSTAAVRKKSSVLISSSSPLGCAAAAATATDDDTSKSKTHKELPATVSASFYLDLGLGQPQQNYQVHPIGKDNVMNNHQDGDFGWFIDTDPTSQREEGDGSDFATHSKVRLSSNVSVPVPLSFSAPIAPVGPSQDQQAEVEWAQAADTVDEVLGDLF